MTKFKDLGLAEPVLKAVLAEGYQKPTPIQAEAIPAMMNGRDVLGVAQTGTGKTAAFVLPQLHAMHAGRKAPPARGATVLILAPTRELATQIAESIQVYGRALKPSVAIVIGGAKPGPQVRTVARGVDFLVATPGRLLDHMQSGAINLDGATTVILDEADQMLDLGFMPAIRKIMQRVPDRRQTLLFSATMPKPIRRLAGDFLKEPAEIAVTPASRPIERINQSVAFVDKATKPNLLARLLKEDAVKRSVVFTRTKHGANRLCQRLGRFGIKAEPIHGNRSQGQREKTLAAFRNGSLSVLVATDIAARGIDIDDVSHVFNYELPNVPEVYIHRIGRTARAGKDGHAVAFCDDAERQLLRGIEKLTGIKLPVMEMDAGFGILAERPAMPVGDRGQSELRYDRNALRKKGRKRSRRAKCNAASANAPQQTRTQGKPASAPNRKRRRRKPASATPSAEAGLHYMLGNIGLRA